MKSNQYYWAIFIIFFCGSSIAEITPGPSANKTGDLGLVIVASGTPDYIEEWLTTPSSHGVTIKRLKQAKPNQLIVTAFLVSGMSADENGNFKFSVSFYLLDPNEKAVFGQNNYARGKGKLPSNPMFTMADPALDIVFEETDPDGMYTIMAQVQDLINGKKANASYKIRLIKSKL